MLLYTYIACIFAVFFRVLDFWTSFCSGYTTTCFQEGGIFFRPDVKNWGLTQSCPLEGADLNHRSATYRFFFQREIMRGNLIIDVDVLYP